MRVIVIVSVEVQSVGEASCLVCVLCQSLEINLLLKSAGKLNHNMDRELLFLDGGLGTTLEDQHGIKFDESTPLWSSHLLISNPDLLRQVQAEFVRAGADIILTPTYQASHNGFKKTLNVDCFDEYMRLAINISREAIGTGLVALSLGAYRATLQPTQEFTGEYGGMDEEGLVEFHRMRLTVDLSTVDLVAFETIPRLDEIRAVKRTVGSKPYWISCVFSDHTLPDGSTVEEVVTAMLADPQPWAIGMNCTKVLRSELLVKEFEDAAERLNLALPRLVLYPDGTNGQSYDTTTQSWVGEEQGDPWDVKLHDIVRKVLHRKKWQGVVIGGCCKTTPQHIEKLRSRLALTSV